MKLAKLEKKSKIFTQLSDVSDFACLKLNS